jgi:hypothetical protein
MFSWFNWFKKKKDAASTLKKLRSGVYIRVNRKPVDMLDLTDEQFVHLLVTELNAFKGKRRVTPELKKRVLLSYLGMVRVQPELRAGIRISAILALQDMGRRFSCVQEEWDECLKTLGLESES